MDIEGTYTLQASPEEVWECLTNKQMLLHTVPGIEQLERVDGQTHSLVMRITSAPLVGVYRARVTVTDQQYPSYYRLVVTREEGQQNTMSGEGVVHLNRRGETTVITYKGSLSLGKIGTLLPSRVVKGAAKLLIQQFFTSLEEQLRTSSSHTNHTNGLYESEEIITISTMKPTTHALATSTARGATPSRTTLLRRLVHLLRLGGGNPVQEEQWVQRIRRTSTISVLLFLVWVGTRLPRR